MDWHWIRPSHVRDHEPSSRASSVELDHGTLWIDHVFHLDSACKEPSADADQRGGNRPLCSRVIASFWLTHSPNCRIINTYTNKEQTMRQTGLIRIVVGLTLVLGAVGGMEHQPEAPLLAQTAVALVGIALMLWAARDINRNTTHTLNNLKGPK
jgi:hypothetical protein